MREHHGDFYKNRSNLDILYELCEYQKILRFWYLGIGTTYVPAKGLPVSDYMSDLPLTQAELVAFCNASIRLGPSGPEFVPED